MMACAGTGRSFEMFLPARRMIEMPFDAAEAHHAPGRNWRSEGITSMQSS